jgi:hypothetical protein
MSDKKEKDKKILLEQPFLVRLNAIRGWLKAPKSRNAGVQFKSRSAEEILQKINPVLHKFGLFFHVSSKPVFISCDNIMRHYIEATVIVYDTQADKPDSSLNMTFTAYAEVADKIMSMNKSQISGAVASYAIKYALGAALNIGTGEDDMDSPQYQNR